MLNSILKGFYERDIQKLIDEINLFQHEETLWKVGGAVRNSAGNLALHIIGGTNHLIGAKLAGTGYVRNREQEFARKHVPREVLVSQLSDLIPMIAKTFDSLSMDDEYPIPFDDATRTNGYVMVQLLAHLNYHLGQVNYLRRLLD